jgi:hypothetical protein
MFAYLKSLFSRKTVDSIIADITAKIEHLHVVAEAHAEAAKIHSEVIAERSKLIVEANTEFDRAKAIAGKLTALVS